MRQLSVHIGVGIVALIAVGVGSILLRNYQINEATLKFKEDDGVAAVGKLKPLAYLGDKAAQFLLGNAYALGQGNLQKSDADAIYWFHRLGSFGPVVIEEGVDPAAPYELGIAKTYSDGAEGIKADPAESLKWLKLAAEGGIKEAATMLAQTPHR